MAKKYVSTKSTVFHPDPWTDSQEFVLLYGDEITTTGDQDNSRDEVIYRDRIGWVRSNRLMDEHPLEIYFVDVGQGDSTFIITPAGEKILIDGGRGDEAFQFLVWKYRLDKQDASAVDIDLLVVSHVDDDHIAGLVSIVRHPLIVIKKIIHSGIAKYSYGFNTSLGKKVSSGGHDYLATRHDGIAGLNTPKATSLMAEWRKAVMAEPGVQYRAVDASMGTIGVGDSAIKLHVLGPRLESLPNSHQKCYRWLGSASKTVNGHSVVLRLDCKIGANTVKVLLPGDINEKGAKYLLEEAGMAGRLDAHIFKAPHHGSHDYHREFLRAAQPQVSVVSSGESPDHGHPRANFLGTVGNLSRSEEPLLFSTELVAHFAVDQDAEALDADDNVDPTDAAMLGQARRRFKKRLNGIINVRSDGQKIYCARRVAAGYQFVTYEHETEPRNG